MLTHFPHFFFALIFLSLNLIIIRPAVVYGVGATAGLSKQRHLVIYSLV